MASNAPICNKCGDSCSIKDEIGEHMGDYGLVHAIVLGGYYSPLLPDGACYEFSLCEACVIELMDSFLIPPKIDDYLHLAFMQGKPKE